MEKIYKCPKCGEKENLHFNYDYNQQHRPIKDVLCNDCGEVFEGNMPVDVFIAKAVSEYPELEGTMNLCEEIIQKRTGKMNEEEWQAAERAQTGTKQETLEEAAESLFPDSSIQKRIFIKGAKWQQEQDSGKDTADYIDKNLVQALVEIGKTQMTFVPDKRMYSEEDLREAYFSAIESTGEGWNGEYADGNNPNIRKKFGEEFEEWFEQFKKRSNEIND